jgi:hypothetical protein
MKDEARIGKIKEFHILGADDCANSRLMEQVLVGGAQ